MAGLSVRAAMALFDRAVRTDEESWGYAMSEMTKDQNNLFDQCIDMLRALSACEPEPEPEP